jgi:hypothetical protein
MYSTIFDIKDREEEKAITSNQGRKGETSSNSKFFEVRCEYGTTEVSLFPLASNSYVLHPSQEEILRTNVFNVMYGCAF